MVEISIDTEHLYVIHKHMNEIETEKYLLILEAVIDECPDDTSPVVMEKSCK